MSDEEIRRTVELPRYFSVLPAFRGIYQDIDYDYPDAVSLSIDHAYHSARQEMMGHDELKLFIAKNHLLAEQEGGTNPDQRYWPGDK